MGIGKLITGSFIILILALGCGGVNIIITPGVPSPPVSFTPIPTLTPRLTLEATSKAVIPTPQPTTTLERGSFIPYFVATSADNVNLRTQPGTLFPVSRLLAKGTRLQVLGHAPGGEWLYVQTDSHIYGWVLFWLVNGGQDSGPTPLVEPQNVQLVTGRVVDVSGVPISGIGFAITQGTGPTAARGDATSDVAGQFYAYLPMSASGQWFVTFVSVSCTSNTMDAKCNCIGGVCGRSDPDRVAIMLPIESPLQFIWK
jgi:SH3-like domain-containing protein